MALVEAPVRQRIEAMYGSRARLTRKIRLNGFASGRPNPVREVLVFALTDHPEACCCCVWEEDGRVHRILGGDPTSDDLRAAIVEHDGDGAE